MYYVAGGPMECAAERSGDGAFERVTISGIAPFSDGGKTSVFGFIRKVCT